MKTFADMHCDTASYIFENKLHLYDSDGHINIKMLEKYISPIQVFAIWLKKEYYTNAFDITTWIIDYFTKEIEINSEKAEIVKNSGDIHKKNKKIKAVLSIEGCEALEGSIEKLRILYDKGIRIATLTWNYKNCVATGVMESGYGGGLTDFGKEAVKEMERLGIIVDVSHLSDEGFYDVEKHTEKPLIATHSNCRAICSFPRNLTDDQLRVIGERGGIVGLNMCVDFLSDSGKAGIEDVIRHTEHMLDICGENSVALGCDFDGIPITPDGIENVARIEYVLESMEKEFGKEITEKIAFANFIRITDMLI